MGISIAVYTAINRSLNRGGGLSRGRHSGIGGDSVRTKLCRY